MLGILLTTIGLFILALGVFYLSPNLNKYLNVFGITEINFTALAAIGTCLIAFANFILLPMALRSNSRAEMLFGAQMMPLVQTKPIKFEMDSTPSKQDGQWFGKTHLRIVNYSNFKAYNVKTDVKYHGPWIGEWFKAAINNLEQKKKKDEKNFSKEDESHLKNYQQTIMINNCDMDPESSPAIQTWTGGCLPREAISENKVIVSVRTTWENERGFQFDSIDKYILIRATMDGGESFTFIPETIGTAIPKL